MKYDYLIIGAGLFGSIFAYEANKLGKKALVIEKRNHIGGNCYTENIENINIHKYGPHIFHTNDSEVYNYLKQFGEFNNYEHSVYGFVDGNMIPVPFNLDSMRIIFGNQN